MATGLVDPLQGESLSTPLPPGILTRIFPPEKVVSVLEATGRSSQRQRDLPAQLMVYYVVALAFYMPTAYREVLRCIWEEVRAVRQGREPWKVAVASALTAARKRLGWEAMRELYHQLVSPVAVPATRGAWYRDWRVVTLDGSTLDVADTPENEAAFGRPKAARGRSAFPQIRLVGLLENGTHLLFRAVLGGYRAAEVQLTQELLPSLRAGMLCLADRGFYSFALWQQALATGSHLLWRVKKDIRLPGGKRLSDGSYLSRVYPADSRHRDPEGGILIRVIEYWAKAPGRRASRCRLVTSLLDPEQAPAEELARLYHERWEIETSVRELKTYLRGAKVVLRSRRPDLVRQEFYGLLLAHSAARILMHEAALQADIDPDRLSFTHTLRVLRRRLPTVRAFFPCTHKRLAAASAAGDSRGACATTTTAPMCPGGQAQNLEIPREETAKVYLQGSENKGAHRGNL